MCHALIVKHVSQTVTKDGHQLGNEHHAQFVVSLCRAQTLDAC